MIQEKNNILVSIRRSSSCTAVIF